MTPPEQVSRVALFTHTAFFKAAAALIEIQCIMQKLIRRILMNLKSE